VTQAVVDLPTALVLAVILATGQTITHSTLFQIARGVVGISARHRKRFEERIARARVLVERWRGRVLVLLSSAATLGLPPMLAVSLAAGSLGIRFRTFVIIGLLGRIVRFTAIAILASLV
jgi:membrane protein YqaA with SNARE-associated domain